MLFVGFLREGKMANWLIRILGIGVTLAINKEIDKHLAVIKENNTILDKLVCEIEDIRADGASAMGKRND